MNIHRLGAVTLAVAVAVAAAVLAAGSATAHHSTAMFNMRESVVLNGTIKEFQWTNPHTWIVFDVPNGKGGSPNYLARVGWDKHTLSSGDKVELTIHPLKDGRKGGFDVSVKLPDGKTMYNLPHGP
jgi:hypothetical protein